MLLRSCKVQSFGLLSFASSILPALPGTKPRQQIQSTATIGFPLSPYSILQSRRRHWMRRLLPITPCFLRATLPAVSHPHIGTSMAPPSLLPASAANEQGTGTGVSNCCAIKELACSRFEQLPRMRLTTRDAPFLRSLSPDLPPCYRNLDCGRYGADGYVE